MPPSSSGFSKRWHDRQESLNPLSEALAARKQSGDPVIDLTLSNPTLCGLKVPTDWTGILAGPEVLTYDPQPQGSLPARQAIAQYYADRLDPTGASDIFLTAGTSEGYTHLFKLLCDPGDSVLVPRPSYPLLETLAELEGIGLSTYPMIPQADSSLDANGGTPWILDRKALEKALTAKTRALFVVQPNNPTGSVLSEGDISYLSALAVKHHLSIVVDEVFADFLQGQKKLRRFPSGGPPVFTLNGLSKLLGLPQLKLAWIHVDGHPAFKSEAKRHLEWIGDAYLSVNTASQMACPELLRRREEFQGPIKERLQANLLSLRELTDSSPSNVKPHVHPIWPQGGWCLPVRFTGSGAKDDETLALNLLQSQGVLTHPGYFFDFDEDVLVLSLLPEPETFREGVRRIVQATRPI